MRNALRALVAVLALQPALAVAQSQVPLPYHSVWGRIGAQPGDTGPGQAIPFANILPIIVGTQSPNTVYAGPSSGAGVALPAFRFLVGADLPFPGAASLGGVQSKTCGASTWVNALSTLGVLACVQPNFTDLAGSIAAGQIPAGVVALTKLATQSANTAVCNATGGAASPTECSKAQITALINAATASLPGALPAWPNDVTKYFNGAGNYVTHNCAALTDSSVGCSAARGQLPGETSTGSAAAGDVGEYISSVIAAGSAVGISTATPANITSISLTAGDWDVAGFITFGGNSTTTVTSLETSISTTTATVDASADRNSLALYSGAPTVFNLGPGIVPVNTGPSRFSLSGTTTVFLVARATFATSTTTAFGTIRARRAR